MKKMVLTLCFALVLSGFPMLVLAKESVDGQKWSPQSVMEKLLKARNEGNDRLFSEVLLTFVSSPYSEDEMSNVLKKVGVPLNESEIAAIERVYDRWFPRLATSAVDSKCLLCRLKNGDGTIRYELVFLNEEELESYQATLYPKETKIRKPTERYTSTWEDRFFGAARDRLIFIGGSPRNDQLEKINAEADRRETVIPRWSRASGVKPTGKNIVLASAGFDPLAIAWSVKENMNMTQVLDTLGHPKIIKPDGSLELWFYTYEFTDKTGDDKWGGILVVMFKAGRAIKEGSWVPNK